MDDRNQWVQILYAGVLSILAAAVIIGILLFAMTFASPRAFAGNPWADSPYNGWADQQEVMPAARGRMGCSADPSLYPPDGENRCSCCKGAEIVKTKFRVALDASDAWDWLSTKTHEWERVPEDIIHWDEPTPDQQGVAFEYPIGSGKLRCFFPPQEGGG